MCIDTEQIHFHHHHEYGRLSRHLRHESIHGWAWAGPVPAPAPLINATMATVAGRAALAIRRTVPRVPDSLLVINKGRALPCLLGVAPQGSGFRSDLGWALVVLCTPGYVRLDTPLLLGAGFLTGGDGY